MARKPKKKILTKDEIFGFERLELKRDKVKAEVEALKAVRNLHLEKAVVSELKAKLQAYEIENRLREIGKISEKHSKHKEDIRKRLKIENEHFGYDDVTGEIDP